MSGRGVCVGQAWLLAGSRGCIQADGVDGDHGTDVVGPQRKRAGQTLVGVESADDVERVHDGPGHRLCVRGGGCAGEDIVVGLGPGQAEDATEGPHQLVLHLQLKLRRGAGAAPVQHDDGVQDVAGGVEAVDGLGDGVLAASAGSACAGAEKHVGDRAVRVVEDGDGNCRGVRAHDVRGKDEARSVEVGILPAHVLGQRAALADGDAGDRDVPDAGCSGYQSVGSLMVDGGAERAGIGVVEEVWLLPADGDALLAGEEGWARDESRAAGGGDRRQ